MYKNYPLRLDSELKERLEALAKEDFRSFNSLVSKLIKDYCDEQDRIKAQQNNCLSCNKLS